MAVVDEFVWNSVTPFYTGTTDKIRTFSQLEREEKDVHSDGTATYTFHFKGLVVAGLDVPTKGFLLQRLEVSTATYSLASGLKLGSPVAEIRAKLGAPANTTNNTLTFQGETEQVVFSVTDNAISKVVFHVYTD